MAAEVRTRATPVTLREILGWLEADFRVSSIPDSRRAMNGLQVAPAGLDRVIRKVATATDAGVRAIDKAARWGADLLIVHHGLTWDGGGVPWPDGEHPEAGRTSALLRSDLALVALHLPLDVHPEYGNDAALASILDLVPVEWALPMSGTISLVSLPGLTTIDVHEPLPLSADVQIDHPSIEMDDERPWQGVVPIGLICTPAQPISRGALARRLGQRVALDLPNGGQRTSGPGLAPGIGRGGARLLPEAPAHRALELAARRVEQVLVATGAAGGHIADAKALGCDIMISGEAPAHAALLAEELDIGLLLGGHHATETGGPRGLVDWIVRRAGGTGRSIRGRFIQAPTGL